MPEHQQIHCRHFFPLTSMSSLQGFSLFGLRLSSKRGIHRTWKTSVPAMQGRSQPFTRTHQTPGTNKMLPQPWLKRERQMINYQLRNYMEKAKPSTQFETSIWRLTKQDHGQNKPFLLILPGREGLGRASSYCLSVGCSTVQRKEVGHICVWEINHYSTRGIKRILKNLLFPGTWQSKGRKNQESSGRAHGRKTIRVPSSPFVAD